MHLLRRRSFALLLAGSTVNAIGSWCALMAMWGFAAFEFDAGPGQVALLILTWAIPGAVLGPFVGVPIDRFGPKAVLVAADALGAAAAVGMLFAHRYEDLLWASAVLGVAKTFAHPADAALPPRLVADEDLVAANALLGAATDSSIVFGPLLATGAIALWGFHAAFVVDAVTWVVGAAVVVPLRLHAVVVERAEPLLAQLVEGYRLTVRTPTLRLTMALSVAVFMTWGAFAVVEPLYVRDVLHRSTTALALLQVAFGVGLVGAGIVVVRLGDRVATTRALACAVLLSGVAAATYIGTGSAAVAAVGVFLWGADVAFFAAPARTLLQRHAPANAHGRVLGLHGTLHSWGDLVALPVTGFLAELVGIQAAALAFAGVAVVAGTLGWFAARRLEVAVVAPQLAPA
ncbi:MAG: putative transporter [Actinomycetia bacterium]|nr:putative transporter [Actinomycetes bacterium]